MSASEPRRPARTLLLALMLAGSAGCGGDAQSGAVQTAGPARGTQAQAPGAAAAGAAAGVGAAAAEGAAGSAAGAGGTGIGTRLLSHPDDLQLVLLGYRLRGSQPPIADWAAAQHAVVRANEFERANVIRQEQARLQGIHDSTADVGRLRFDVRAQLSEYDGARGGYYLDAFAPGSVFNFSARIAAHPFTEESITLQVQNEEELNFWPLDAAAAQEVLRRNDGMRNVVLDSQFRVLGVAQRSGGPVILLRLQRYAITSTKYGQPAVLGEQVFPE